MQSNGPRFLDLRRASLPVEKALFLNDDSCHSVAEAKALVNTARVEIFQLQAVETEEQESKPQWRDAALGELVGAGVTFRLKGDGTSGGVVLRGWKKPVYILLYKPRFVLTSREPKAGMTAEQAAYFPSVAKYSDQLQQGQGQRLAKDGRGATNVQLHSAGGGGSAGAGAAQSQHSHAELAQHLPFVTDLLADLARRRSESEPSANYLSENELRKISPVGRLDLESEGLLLLTSDPTFSTVVTSPQFEIRKKYRVLVKSQRVACKQVSASDTVSSPHDGDLRDQREHDLEQADAPLLRLRREDRERVVRARWREALERQLRALAGEHAAAAPPSGGKTDPAEQLRAESCELVDFDLCPPQVFASRFVVARGMDEIRSSTSREFLGDHQAEPVREEQLGATRLPSSSRSARDKGETDPEQFLGLAVVDVVLTEGKKREVRKLMRSIGFTTLLLIRIELAELNQVVAIPETVAEAMRKFGDDTNGIDLERARRFADGAAVDRQAPNAVDAAPAGAHQLLAEASPVDEADVHAGDLQPPAPSLRLPGPGGGGELDRSCGPFAARLWRALSGIGAPLGKKGLRPGEMRFLTDAEVDDVFRRAKKSRAEKRQ